MRNIVTLALFAFILGSPLTALAENTLTADQLLKATQQAISEAANEDPDMAKSISGFRVTTVGPNASVTVEMNADGMRMSSKYLCAPRGETMTCRPQQ